MNLKVSYGEMETAAQQLETGREQITTQLMQMQQQIQGLISSGFVTEVASGRFASAFEQYTQGARTVIDQLTEIQGFLRTTATTLQETDAQIAARIGG
ncbi:MAG: WXG100 family type VII secretion target [Microbacteriaceae bacterium]|nr:WXG100 family type VII secretion target [Microbacteriaceae bacterium]